MAFYSNWTDKISGHLPIIKNFSYLSIIQILNLIIPLIVYPYLVITLGTENYGIVIFAQTIVSFLAIVINYGFNVSATKEIAFHEKNHFKRKKIITAVYIIKIVIWLFFLFVLNLICFAFYPDYLVLMNFTYLISCNELIFPQWYFQGIQKMAYLTIFNLLSKGLFLVLVFSYISTDSDYIVVPLLQGLSIILGGIFGFFLLYKEENYNLILAHPRFTWLIFKKSTPLFLSQLIIAFKDKCNIIFIGLFLTKSDIAIYDIALKLLHLLHLPSLILNDAIYPNMAKKFDWRFVKKILKLLLIITSIGFVTLQFLLKPILDFLFKSQIINELLPVRVLLISAIILCISVTLSRNVIIANNKYNKLLTSMIATTLFYFSLVLLGYLNNSLDSIFVFIIIALVVYTFELIYRLILSNSILKKHR